MHAQVGEALSREHVLPAVIARSNAMARNLAKLVDGTGSLSCVPTQSVMTLKVHQGKGAELSARMRKPRLTPEYTNQLQ
jgi:hypothetical protein